MMPEMRNPRSGKLRGFQKLADEDGETGAEAIEPA